MHAINVLRYIRQSKISVVMNKTGFCNGPDDVKSPCGLAAGLLLLSEVGAEAATLCCQKEAASLSNNAWFVG
jgi:hypothetical protein